MSAALALGFVLVVTGCKKPVPPPPPTPKTEAPKETPPPPKKPTVNFVGEPSAIQRGDAATLRWQVTDADSIRIEPGVGSVQANGNRQVYPTSSTTYTLTATGPGGSTTATAYINVAAPAAKPPEPTPTVSIGFSERLAREVADVMYDYNQSEIREDARATLQRNAEALKTILKDFPNDVVQVEGHCDERGSAEYNLGLGDRRAASAKEFLVSLGIPADKLKVISYGKERPQCTEATEGCWQRNRRAHFAAGQ